MTTACKGLETMSESALQIKLLWDSKCWNTWANMSQHQRSATESASLNFTPNVFKYKRHWSSIFEVQRKIQTCSREVNRSHCQSTASKIDLFQWSYLKLVITQSKSTANSSVEVRFTAQLFIVTSSNQHWIGKSITEQKWLIFPFTKEKCNTSL